jgi:FkbM family methyltransferase
MAESLETIARNIGIPVQDGKIVIPDWVTSIKIDVGIAYDAPHTQNWLDADPGTIVFCFEANPRWIKYLNTPPKDRNYNFKDYVPARPGTPYKELEFDNIGRRCFIFPVALHNVSEPTTMDFYVTDVSEGCCSLLKPTADFSAISQVAKVPVFSLSDFFKLLPDDKIVDFVKIDVQGVDLQVIKSAGQYISDRVVYVTAEPETATYENASDNTPENMTAYLATCDFVRVGHRNTRDPTFLNKKFYDRANVYIFQYF